MKKVNIKNQKKSLICLAIGLALSNGVFAEDVAATNEESQLEEVVVWGTQVSSSSEYLGEQDLSVKQATHMSELLRELPGVDVGGTHSLVQKINIRGLGESDLDITLDGASQHANMFHHIGNLTLNPDILKSVDVKVGNNSVTQSSIGGSVAFETKDGKDLLRDGESFGTRIYGGYATNSNQQGSITTYGLLGENVDAMFYGNLVDSDNFTDGDGTETVGSEGSVGNALFKIGYEPSDKSRLELSYDMYRDSGDYSARPDMSGTYNTYRATELVPTDYDRDTITASYEYNGTIHSGKVNIYSSTTEITRDESVITTWPSNRKSVNSATNENIGINANIQSNINIADFNNQFNYGFETMQQSSSSVYGGVKYMDEKVISNALFLEDKFYFSPNFSITAGLRYDHDRRDAMTSDTSYNDVTWALSADWDIAKNVSLFASTRSLFKSPELLESFIRYHTTSYLDDDIVAQTGLNTQIGARYSGQVREHFFSSSATIFKTDINDYLHETWNGSGYTIENTGDAEIKGFEISASYAYNVFMSKFSYSRSESNNTTTNSALVDVNDRSVDIGDSISLTLDYQIDSIDTVLGWTSTIVLEEDNVEDGGNVKEAYNTHNIYVQWMPSDIDGLQVTFGIDNITDEYYVSHASRSGGTGENIYEDYEPGVNYKLSAAYQF